MKKTKKVWLGALGCAFALTIGGAAYSMNAVEANAEGETYYLTFGDKEDWTESDKIGAANLYQANCKSIAYQSDIVASGKEAIKITTNGEAYGVVNPMGAGLIEYKAGQAYTVSFKMYGDPFHLFVDHGVSSMLDDWIRPTAGEWTDYEFTFTPASNVTRISFLFKSTTGASEQNIYIDDLCVRYASQVTEGSAIGELPALDEGAVWTIDGETVTADTVYDYGANKTALRLGKNTLSFAYPDRIESIGEGGYGAVANATYEITETDAYEGKALHFATGTANAVDSSSPWICLSDTPVAAGSYVVNFKMLNSKYVNIRYEIGGYTFGANAVMLQENVSNKSAWTEYSYTIDLTEEVSSLYLLLHVHGNGAGNIYVDELSFGAALTPVTVMKGQAIGTLPDLSSLALPSEHYESAFWTVDGEAINADTVWAYRIDKQAAVAYKAKEYTVSFTADGEEVASEIYTVEDTEITEPAVPAKEHYDGVWEEYVLDGGDKTVNAVYTAKTYTVTFVADGKTVGEKTYTVEDTAIEIPAVPEKQDHAGAWESFELNGGDKVVNAVYIQGYTVKFYADGVLVGQDTFNDMDKDITEPAVPEKEHYDGTWESYVLGNESIEVNAVYTAKTYTVTFTANGETVAEETYTVEDTAVTEPSVPAKEHYENGAWEAYTLDGGDKTVNATYEAIEYTVTFTANGETVAEETYTVEDTEITEPAVPEKTHYENGTWETYTLDGGDKTVNATYNLKVYTVTFLAGDDVVAMENYTIESTAVTEPEVPAKEGYIGAWGEYTLDGGNKTVMAVYTEVEAEPEPTPEQPAPEEESGCGSAIGAVAGGVALVCAAALTLRKKKED